MKDQESLWYLDNVDLPGLFCPQQAKSVNGRHLHKHFKKGDYIYLPEELADRIYFLIRGRVKICNHGEGGREITKVILNTGEIFGELSLIGEMERRDFAIAMEDTECCVLTVGEMKNLMRNHSAINLMLMKVMGSRMLQMEKRLESLVFKDSRTRIIEYLLELTQRRGQRVGYELVVRKFITHQEIANITATSRQTVTTVLNDLRNKNLLTFDRRRLLVRDLEKLHKELQV